MLRCVVLCCVVLRFVVLCCVVLCCVALCCVVLCCVVLRCVVQCCVEECWACADRRVVAWLGVVVSGPVWSFGGLSGGKTTLTLYPPRWPFAGPRNVERLSIA